jgi:hypothetical protein
MSKVFKAKAIIVTSLETFETYNAGIICCDCSKELKKTEERQGKLFELIDNRDLMDSLKRNQELCGMGCDKEVK